MLQQSFKFNYYHLGVFLILVVALGLRCYRFSDKETLYNDELLTIPICTYSDYGWTTLIEQIEEPRSGKEVKSMVFGDDNSLRNIGMDVWNLRKYTRDGDHTNLYYSLIRPTQLYVDTSDLMAVATRGFILNLALFIIGFFYFYRLASLLSNQPLVKLLMLTVAFLLPVSIANTLFMREYQLQETLFIAFTYYFVLLCFKIKEKENILHWKYVLPFSLSIALLSLSGYFAALYILVVGCVMLGVMIHYKATREKYVFAGAGILVSLMLILIIYPVFFSSLSSNRSGTLLEKFTIGSFLGEVSSAMSHLWMEVQSYYSIWLLAILLLVMIFGLFVSKRSKSPKFKTFLIFGVFFSSLLWMLLIFYMAPYKYIRYVCGVFPLLAVLLGLLDPLKRYAQAALGLVIVGLVLFKSFSTKDVYWGNINIYNQYKEYLDLPLIIVGATNPGSHAVFAPHYEDSRPIYFVYTFQSFTDAITSQKGDCVVIKDISYRDFYLPLGYEIVERIFAGDEWPYESYRIRKEENN